MKKYIFVLMLLAGTLNSYDTFAQYAQDLGGMPFTEKKRENVTGSPYFNDTFLKGSIKLDNNAVYDNIYLRYDQELDQLVYRKGPQAATMEATGKVVEFKIETPAGTPAVFRSIVKGDEKTDGFYQVIQDGTTVLLKRTKKILSEGITGYSSGSPELTITAKTEYFLLKSGQLTPVKTDRKSFIKALNDKAKPVEDYIAAQNISFRSDADMAKLIAYYNTL